MNDTPTQTIRSLRHAGSALKVRRQACKMTQKQLSALTGTAQSTISDIETGFVSVSLDVYLRLLEAMNAELRIEDRAQDKDLL